MVFYPWTWRWNKSQAYPSRTRLPPLAESPLPEIQGISEGIMKWYGTWNNGWYMECLTLIFHVFPGSQIAVERVKGVARCADCLLKSQNIFQPGRHACRIPQTALPSWQPRSLRKISTAKVVGVSLCTWDLRHVRRRCQRAGNHLGGQTSFISDSLRYLISPKLKTKEENIQKHPFLAVGQKLYRWYTVTKNRHVEIALPSGGVSEPPSEESARHRWRHRVSRHAYGSCATLHWRWICLVDSYQ